MPGSRIEFAEGASPDVRNYRVDCTLLTETVPEYQPRWNARDGARELYEADPDRFFYANQYDNPANWGAHFAGTGPEIWRQTRERVTHFVAGLGTSGTFMGVGRFLRSVAPYIKLYGMQPDSPFHGLEGLKHMESAIVPGIYDPNLADGILEVSTEDAHEMVKRLAREEGVLVGISSAANLIAALKLADRLEDGVIVTIFADNGDRYLSERFWEEDFGYPSI